MKSFINTLIKNRKPLFIGLGMLAIMMIWIGGSLVSLVHNKTEKHKLARQNEVLDQEYQQLLHTKELLEKQDDALLEKIARTEYNLAKPDEIEFRFPVEK